MSRLKLQLKSVSSVDKFFDPAALPIKLRPVWKLFPQVVRTHLSVKDSMKPSLLIDNGGFGDVWIMRLAIQQFSAQGLADFTANWKHTNSADIYIKHDGMHMYIELFVQP